LLTTSYNINLRVSGNHLKLHIMGQELTFHCYSCDKDSKFSKLQDEEIRRMGPSREKMKVKVFCEHCHKLNEIELTGESIKAILGNYFNKGGDIGSLIDIFKKL